MDRAGPVTSRDRGGAEQAVTRAVDSEKPMRPDYCWQFEAASRLGEHPALLTAPAVSYLYPRYDEERHLSVITFMLFRPRTPGAVSQG